MARNMPTASNARSVGRPAQGRRTDTAFSRPRPAYAADNGTPRVVNAGTLSHPRSATKGPRYKTLTADVQPRVVQL
jgi:hypothetical protein